MMAMISQNLTGRFTHGQNVSSTKSPMFGIQGQFASQGVVFTRSIPCFVMCLCVFIPTFQLDTYENN
jgi:hypothetical protein